MSEKIISGESDLIAARYTVTQAREEIRIRPAGNFEVWVREELGGKLRQVDPNVEKEMRVKKHSSKEFFLFRRTELPVSWGIGPQNGAKVRMRGEVIFQIVNPVALEAFPHPEYWKTSQDGLSVLYTHRCDASFRETGLLVYLRGEILRRLSQNAASLSGASEEDVGKIILKENFWTACGVEKAPVVKVTYCEEIKD